MTDKKLYGYARISTPEQKLDPQIIALKNYGCKQENIYIDKKTGTTLDRPGLNELKKILKKGDTLVVYKIDRLGRSLINVLNFIEVLNKNEIEFHSITESQLGKPFLVIACLFAEMERNLIIERSLAGMKAAKLKGIHCGRPKIKKEKIDMLISLYKSGEHKIGNICKMLDISKSAIYKHLPREFIKK